MPASWATYRRMARFLMVGGCCFGVQYAVMILIARTGIPWPVANAVGFAVSAQVNFVLSSVFTWGDRRGSTAGPGWLRWASYNATALLGLAVNTAAFTAGYHLVGALVAAAAGVATGTVVTYLVCNYLVFRPVRGAERVPGAEPA